MLNSRAEFKIAITEPPTSPITAIHLFAKPSAPGIITTAFTLRVNTIFIVFRAILTVDAILRVLSSVITIYTSSIAALDPMLPTAIPIYWGVINTITDKCQAFFTALSFEQPLHYTHFVRG